MVSVLSTPRRAPLVRRAALLVALALPAVLDAQAPSEAKPAAAPAARRTPTRQVLGAIVEVKCADVWRKGTIKNPNRSGWYLVAYDAPATQEWVEPWRVRVPGSDYDIGTATVNPMTLDSHGLPGPPPRTTPGPAPVENADASAPIPVTWPITPVDLTKTPETPLVAAIKWSYQPAAVDAKVRDATTALVGGVQTDGSDTPIALEPSGGVVLVAYQSKSEPKVPVAEVVDLASGKLVARVELNPASRPMSVSPDGKRLFCRAEGAYPGTMARVDVWDIEQPAAAPKPGAAAPTSMPAFRGSPKLIVSFDPYESEAAKDVDRAIALDADRVLTVNRDGHAIAWKVGAGAATPIWLAKLGDSALALSPDRRTIATLSKGALQFLNAADGKVVGTIETAARTVSAMSFRGDGKRLALLAGPTLYEFNLETGKQVASIGVPIPALPVDARQLDVRHLTGDAVLVIGAKLTAIDVATSAILSQFTLFEADRTTIAGDRLVALIRGGAKRSLANWAIATKPEAAVALPPVPGGAATRATIDVMVEVDEFAKRAVFDSLKRQVAARGWTLVESGQPASVHITGKVEDGKGEPRAYEWMGKREMTDVTPRMTRLSIDVDGRPAWTASMGSTAVAAQGTDKAQTILAVQEAARRPNVAFLKNTQLPDTLFQPIDALPTTVPQVTLRPGAIKE